MVSFGLTALQNKLFAAQSWVLTGNDLVSGSIPQSLGGRAGARGRPLGSRSRRRGGLSWKETHFLVASEEVGKAAPWGGHPREPLVLSKDCGGQAGRALAGKLLTNVLLGTPSLTPEGWHGQSGHCLAPGVLPWDLGFMRMWSSATLGCSGTT